MFLPGTWVKFIEDLPSSLFLSVLPILRFRPSLIPHIMLKCVRNLVLFYIQHICFWFWRLGFISELPVSSLHVPLFCGFACHHFFFNSVGFTKHCKTWVCLMSTPKNKFSKTHSRMYFMLAISLGPPKDKLLNYFWEFNPRSQLHSATWNFIGTSIMSRLTGKKKFQEPIPRMHRKSAILFWRFTLAYFTIQNTLRSHVFATQADAITTKLKSQL